MRSQGAAPLSLHNDSLPDFPLLILLIAARKFYTPRSGMQNGVAWPLLAWVAPCSRIKPSIHPSVSPSVRPSVHPSCCILYRHLHHEFAIEEPKEIGTDGQTVDADDDDVHFTCAKFSRRSELQTVEKRALVVPLSLTATTPRYSCCQNEFLFLKCDGCRFIRT